MSSSWSSSTQLLTLPPPPSPPSPLSLLSSSSRTLCLMSMTSRSRQSPHARPTRTRSRLAVHIQPLQSRTASSSSDNSFPPSPPPPSSSSSTADATTSRLVTSDPPHRSNTKTHSTSSYFYPFSSHSDTSGSSVQFLSSKSFRFTPNSMSSLSSHWLPILTVLLLLLHTSHAWGFECPKQCECHNLRDPNRVSTSMAARCRVNDSMARYNFSVFSPRYTTVLVLQCQGKALTPVNHMFRDLFYLEELVFKDCRFTTIPDYTLAGLTNLKNFSIFGADRLTFTPRLFQKLMNLQNLEIIRSGFQSVPVNFLCHSTRIRSLIFSENEIFTLRDLKNLCLVNATLLGQISRLDLSYNNIKEITEDFDAMFTGIELVNFVGNKIESIVNNSCSELYDLTVLDLSRNRIKEFPLDFLEYSDNLMQLGLSHNPISRLFPVFSSLSNLRIFEAEHTHLDNNIWSDLNEKPQLESLNLAYCRLSLINKSVMNKLTSLIRLNLHSNSISRLSPNVFSSNRKLEVLILTNNSLIHLDENSLHGLTGLRHLDLSYNSLSAIHIDAFHDLINVEKLDMSYNELQEIPNSIHPLNRVQELYFEGNQIRRIYKDFFKGMDSVNRIVLAKKPHSRGRC